MIQTKTQWAEFAGGEAGIWASDASWRTRRPDSDHVVKDWGAAIPLVGLQSRQGFFCLKAPELTKTPTLNKWFYNEQDGYFYYIGLLRSQETVLPPVDCSDPQYDATELYGSFLKDIKYRVYGEAVEANKDAVAAAWGLTFEPGSLGAAIFG